MVTPEPDASTPIASRDSPNPHETPAYILEAAQAAERWWRQQGESHKHKLRGQTVLRLLEGVREGLTYEGACGYAGVSYEIFRQWMHRGDHDEGETTAESVYVILACAIKLAEGEAEYGMVREMRAAGRDPRFWAANARILEHRHPERWLRREQPIQVHVGLALGYQLSEEQRAHMVPIAQIASEHEVLSPAGDAGRSIPARAGEPRPALDVGRMAQSEIALARPDADDDGLLGRVRASWPSA